MRYRVYESNLFLDLLAKVTGKSRINGFAGLPCNIIILRDDLGPRRSFIFNHEVQHKQDMEEIGGLKYRLLYIFDEDFRNQAEDRCEDVEDDKHPRDWRGKWSKFNVG
jgi:hypothetical protein